MNRQTKIIIAGVGGQGVVFLTEILVDAAVKANIPVATSEVHGLSQRGGSVISGITMGKNTYGFVEEGGADFLLGLELSEAQRSLSYLHNQSIAVIDTTRIFPHSVNSGKAQYPEEQSLKDFLKATIKEVIFLNKLENIEPVMRNIAVLAKAVSHKNFPVKPGFIEDSIRENARGNPAKALKVFRELLNN